MSSPVRTFRALTARKIAARKGKEPIVCLTAYTAPIAEILDPRSATSCWSAIRWAWCVHGLPNTVGVTMEMMILHGQAVMRGQPPRHGGRRHAVRLATRPRQGVAYDNAVRILKETGAHAVKVESGPDGRRDHQPI